MDEIVDPNLGKGIFIWKGKPTIQVFEDGFTYDGTSYLELCYKEMTSLDLLDLPSLMKAKKMPLHLVEFTVLTANGRHVLHVPLLLYTTLSKVLCSMLVPTEN